MGGIVRPELRVLARKARRCVALGQIQGGLGAVDELT